MMGQGKSDELRALQERWHRWTAIVELFARHRRARCRVDEHAYCTLHREVIEGCRALARTADEAKRAFYQDLEALAHPWLTLAVLARENREILFDLLIRCRQAERELCGRPKAPAARGWTVPALAAVAAAVGAVLWTWIADRGWLPILNRVQDWSDVAW